MSELLQHGHLDPDTLSAFAEGVLPPHEREATLAHLAVCGHCRQLVQLAQPPFEETLPAPIPARRGFTGWRWVWAGAAACAGVGLAALLLVPHAPPAVDVAKVQAPALPSLPAPLPVPQAPPLLTTKPAARAPRAKAAIVLGGVAGRVNPQAEPAGASPESFATSAYAAAPPIDSKKIQALPSMNRSFALHQRARTAENTDSLAASAALGAVAASPAPVAAAAAPPPVAAAQPGAGAAQSVTVEANSSVAGMETTSAAVAQWLPELPSHLATASRYAKGKRVVAADTAGTVFFSKDAGMRWKRVKARWSGRVAQVSAASETVTDASPASTRKVLLAPVFALVTSSGERWVSVDGKKWTRE